MRPNLLAFLSAVFLLSPLAGQNSAAPAAANYPYLLHLETMNFDNQVCVLLHSDGEFHLEQDHGDRTKVFEGKLPEAKLVEIQKLINDEGLRDLTQKQIIEPKGSIMLDQLNIDIFRGDHWQDIFFPDDSTRKPFERSIAPLVRWLDALRKEPHTEIGEDEGRNDCQIPKRIVLRGRPPASGKAAPHP